MRSFRQSSKTRLNQGYLPDGVLPNANSVKIQLLGSQLVNITHLQSPGPQRFSLEVVSWRVATRGLCTVYFIYKKIIGRVTLINT